MGDMLGNGGMSHPLKSLPCHHAHRLPCLHHQNHVRPTMGTAELEPGLAWVMAVPWVAVEAEQLIVEERNKESHKRRKAEAQVKGWERQSQGEKWGTSWIAVSSSGWKL